MTIQQARNILGVSGSASKKEVKKAYRKKARETHPDTGGSEKEFVRVKQAYDILKDPSGAKKSAGNWNNEQRNYSYQNVRNMYEEFINEVINERHQRGFKWEDRFGDDWNADFRDMKHEERMMFVNLEDLVNGIVKKDFTIPAGTRDGEKITTAAGLMNVQLNKSKSAADWSIINEHDLLYTCRDLTLIDFLVGTKVRIESIHRKKWNDTFSVYEGEQEKIKLTIPENSLPNTRYKISGHGMAISNDPWNTRVDRGDLYVDFVPKKASVDVIEKLKNSLRT